MNSTTTRRGLVVSDLHLFSRRSDGDRLFESLKPRLDSVDELVLNGDTFDFRWSQLPSETASIDAAIRWLEKLAATNPGLRVHFLLGNHDCLAVFHRELQQLARTAPNLRCFEHRLQLGENLFLHGDCANWKMDEAGLAKSRKSWQNDRQRGPFGAAAYDAADALRLSHWFHAFCFPRHRTVRRIAHHLDQVHPGWHRQVGHCFFGHTHLPFLDYEWRGVRFSNTGSAIPGMGFQPLEFDWEPNPQPHFSDERKSHLLL